MFLQILRDPRMVCSQLHEPARAFEEEEENCCRNLIEDVNGHFRNRNSESLPEAKYKLQRRRSSHQFLMTENETACEVVEMNLSLTRLVARDNYCGVLRVANPARLRDLLLSKTVQTGSGVHPALFSANDGVLSPRVKRPGHEVDP
jgi:hypothetical protein